MESLASANAVQIYSSPALEAIGLSALTTMSGTLSIQECASLVELSGLDALDEVRTLNIYNNDSLVSLDGLSGVQSVVNIFVGNNDSLTSIAGLYGLTEFGGETIAIYNNDSLCRSRHSAFVSWVTSTLTPPSGVDDRGGDGGC